MLSLSPCATCTICEEEYLGSAARDPHCLPCGHIMCLPCINQVSECPMCRKEFPRSAVVRIFIDRSVSPNAAASRLPRDIELEERGRLEVALAQAVRRKSDVQLASTLKQAQDWLVLNGPRHVDDPNDVLWTLSSLATLHLSAEHDLAKTREQAESEEQALRERVAQLERQVKEQEEAINHLETEKLELRKRLATRSKTVPSPLDLSSSRPSHTFPPSAYTAPATEHHFHRRTPSSSSFSSTRPAIPAATAREFIPYYCSRSSLGQPTAKFGTDEFSYKCTLITGRSMIGRGRGDTQEEAEMAAYVNAAGLLAEKQPEVWGYFLGQTMKSPTIA